ncbi:MAG: HAMP domain-containing sensor histidine kinase [Sulfurimonas sp.]|nr:HAMP domain-containing sensor histidine kinase [Sulfurimonas sp.]
MFFFSTIFVVLLVEEMYLDYEVAIEKNFIDKENSLSVNELNKEKKQKLKSLLIKTALVTVTLAFILLGIFFGLNNIFNRILQRDTQSFLDFFESAVNQDKVKVPQSIFFKDFKVMIGFANEMVETINKQKQSLRELNKSLEIRVKKKTKELQEININLEKEKVFSQELLSSQKEFLRYAVHETNTPLSVILTSIELYEMNNKKDRQLSKIEAAVKNIFSIYDDLSYLVKKDQVEYPKIVLNFEKYIGSRIDFFMEVAELSRIHFEYKPEAIDAHIFFNETKLQRIVDNTITNAIKYTLPNELVKIKLEKVGMHLEFSIGSKSKIIENTDKVFEAYYREDSQDGFGLGLKLVRSICDEEDVEIKVSSKEVYTVFTYKFKMMGL